MTENEAKDLSDSHPGTVATTVTKRQVRPEMH